MKVRLFFVVPQFLLAAAVMCMALDRPNFSGTWEMDTGRSFGVPPGMKQTMTVVHKGDQFEVEVKTMTSQGERTTVETFVADGKEREFTPQTGKGRRSTNWLPDGRGIVISDQTTVETPDGSATTHTLRKWILRGEGSQLFVDSHIDSPRGSGETRRMYRRK